MKLAEALVLRADYQNKISELKIRISNNVKVQEGEEALENPNELLCQLNNIFDELEEIIKRINKTNSYVMLDEELSLSDAIAVRDSIKRKRNILTSVVSEGTIKQDRYSLSEVKFVTTINISNLQKEADKLAKEYRLIDLKIQAKNWTTELM